ncbi:hypothetical protein AAVH_21001 [Aphelenchoides avenae]|nr:hypothetical protein AAVH_21001 [Aphelenchus avenae]
MFGCKRSNCHVAQPVRRQLEDSNPVAMSEQSPLQLPPPEAVLQTVPPLNSYAAATPSTSASSLDQCDATDQPLLLLQAEAEQKKSEQPPQASMRERKAFKRQRAGQGTSILAEKARPLSTDEEKKYILLTIAEEEQSTESRTNAGAIADKIMRTCVPVESY